MQSTDKGAPQGGPLSPPLSNFLPDDLDKELEKRGHAFCDYADDCNVDIGSRRSAERVMAALIGFLEETLKLKGHRARSAVERPVNRVFLGRSFTAGKHAKIRMPPKTCRKIRERTAPALAGRSRTHCAAVHQRDAQPATARLDQLLPSQPDQGFAEELDG